eukprot:441767-Rhodomonas_salina.9
MDPQNLGALLRSAYFLGPPPLFSLALPSFFARAHTPSSPRALFFVLTRESGGRVRRGGRVQQEFGRA